MAELAIVLRTAQVPGPENSREGEQHQPQSASAGKLLTRPTKSSRIRAGQAAPVARLGIKNRAGPPIWSCWLQDAEMPGMLPG